MGNMGKYGFPIYTLDDEVKPYNGEELKAGFYEIGRDVDLIVDEHSVKLKLPKYAKIHTNFVHYLLEHKYIKKYEIISQYVSSYYLPCDYFKDVIEEVIKTMTTQGKNPNALWKDIINLWIGGTYKHETETQKNMMTESIIDVIKYMEEHNGDCDRVVFDLIDNEKEDSKPYYLIRHNTLKPKLEGNFPIFLYVISGSWISIMQLYDKIKAFRTKKYPNETHLGIIKIKSDSISVAEGELLDKKEYTNNIGGYKKEKYKYVNSKTNTLTYERGITESKISDTKMDDSLNIDDYTNDLQKKITKIIKDGLSCCLYGRAGTGKTYTLNEINKIIIKYQISKIMTKNKKTCMFASLTNCAVNNMKNNIKDANAEPETLSKFLYNENIKKIGEERALNELVDKYNYMVIDEFSMITSDIYAKLWKLRCKGMNLILLGDSNQCAPPEKNNIIRFKTQSFSSLVDETYIELTKIIRYDSGLAAVLSILLKDGIVENKFGSDLQAFNICYTNKMRHYINKTHVENRKDEKKSLKLKKTLGEGENKYSFTIHPGTFIIAKQTNKGLNYMNNQLFKVTSWDNKEIKCCDVCDKKKYNLPIDVVQKHFVLAYAITTHSAQGLTLDFNYCIHEMDKMDKNLIYTALSRAKKMNQINIINYSDKVFKNHTNKIIQTELKDGMANGLDFIDAVVYALIDKDDKIFYIGSTCNQKQRLEAHKETYGKRLKKMEIIKKVKNIQHISELEEEERKIMYFYALEGCKLENKEFMTTQFAEYKKALDESNIKPYEFEEIKAVDFKYSNDTKNKVIVYSYKAADGKFKKKKFSYGKTGLNGAVNKLREWINITQ